MVLAYKMLPIGKFLSIKNSAKLTLSQSVQVLIDHAKYMPINTICRFIARSLTLVYALLVAGDWQIG